MGFEITDLRPARAKDGAGSIIVIVAKRVSIGIAVMGGCGDNSSGDIFLAFWTANAETAKSEGVARLEMLPNERTDLLLRATAEAAAVVVMPSPGLHSDERSTPPGTSPGILVHQPCTRS